jgi:hypothetical protein
MSYDSTNEGLLAYLLGLAKLLRDRGYEAAAQKVQWASGFAIGSPSEFLGETKIALKSVVEEQSVMLSDQEQDEVNTWLTRIESAFKAVGDC